MFTTWADFSGGSWIYRATLIWQPWLMKSTLQQNQMPSSISLSLYCSQSMHQNEKEQKLRICQEAGEGERCCSRAALSHFSAHQIHIPGFCLLSLSPSRSLSFSLCQQWLESSKSCPYALHRHRTALWMGLQIPPYHALSFLPPEPAPSQPIGTKTPSPYFRNLWVYPLKYLFPINQLPPSPAESSCVEKH